MGSAIRGIAISTEQGAQIVRLMRSHRWIPGAWMPGFDGQAAPESVKPAEAFDQRDSRGGLSPQQAARGTNHVYLVALGDGSENVGTWDREAGRWHVASRLVA